MTDGLLHSNELDDDPTDATTMGKPSVKTKIDKESVRRQRSLSKALPLYDEGGLLVIPTGTAAPATLVVFVPERIDMAAGMVYGSLPEYGGTQRTLAAIPHKNLARSRKGIKSILHSIRRSRQPMAAEIVSIDDISADGVADLSVDEQLAVEANDGDGDDDASWRLLSNFRCSVTLDRSHLDADKDDAFVVDRWQRVSRAAAVVDNAAIAVEQTPRSGRRTWLWGALKAIRIHREKGVENTCTTGLDEETSEAARSKASTVPCCQKGHAMAVSDGAMYYRHFECNQCGEAETGRRWFCRECHDDLCFACFPAPVSKKQALANSSAAAASSQEDQDDDDDGDQQSEDVADTQLLLDFFVELARSRGELVERALDGVAPS